VTSLSLSVLQLEPLVHIMDKPAVKGLLAQLKRVVVGHRDGSASTEVPEVVGRLLWACTQLEEVELHAHCRQPWLLLDPASTSSSSAVGPPLPLRRLTVSGMPPQLVAGWMQQRQQQLRRTLHSLGVSAYDAYGVPDLLDVGQLTGLVALRGLHLHHTGVTASTQLGSMSSLTWLELSGRGTVTAASVEAVRTLPNLRHLLLQSVPLQQLPDGVRALKQLTSIIINRTGITELPADLGVWCPGLARLEVRQTPLAAVPASLGALTWLKLVCADMPQLVLPTTLTCLKELDLASAGYGKIIGVSSLTALERLEATGCQGDVFGGCGLDELRPLSHLRHLNLSRGTGLFLESFTAVGALQQLTCLDLAEVRHTATSWAALAGAAPLPALRQLDLSADSYDRQQHRVEVLAPWLSRLTALTLLKVPFIEASASDDFLYLPPQLRMLDMGNMGLQQVPLGLRQLSALRVVNLECNPGIHQLPNWCSEMCSLEQLALCGTGVATEQQVLGHMRGLRGVLVMQSQAAVCSAVPHLQVYAIAGAAWLQMHM
jgi:Leucine-rich repeat (LRR) protein